MLLPLLSPESDLFLILQSCCHHSLDPSRVKWQQDKVACTVVAAAEGYPGKVSTGAAVSVAPGTTGGATIYYAGSGHNLVF